MFIAVSGNKNRMREIPAYLYIGQTVVTEPVETPYGAMVIVDTATDESYRSTYVRDRIASGMFGAILFDTREEAEEYIRSESR